MSSRKNSVVAAQEKSKPCEVNSRVKGKDAICGLLTRMYRAMRGHFGHRNWWPGNSPFEVCVGAVLTQNTAWRNVVRAIHNLKAAAALDPFRIHELSHDELAALIRPAGYFNVKARRLRNFVDHLVLRHQGESDNLFQAPVEALRRELLFINGVGKETADSIILYAAGKPIFVVDAYTRRILGRHGLVSENADYDTVQLLFHAHVPRDVALYNDFHAQFVAVGHSHCKRVPLCDSCPLGPFRDHRPVNPHTGSSSKR
ncbi:MAG: endonuclease III domain-containing protein [Deltaproteobacteria bacterium]|nr:endonuclease III domain-containing protein [Deltaproteobacteria bacterium]